MYITQFESVGEMILIKSARVMIPGLSNYPDNILVVLVELAYSL